MMLAQPVPSGSRKRTRAKEMTQSERERLDDEAVLKAEKAVKRAGALVERAGKAEEQAASRCTAAVNKLEKCVGLIKKHAALDRLSRLSMLHWGAAREFRLEAEIVELRAEVRRQDAELDRAHNDMASSLEREGRLEVHCEELLASAKDSQKKMKGLIMDLTGKLTVTESKLNAQTINEKKLRTTLQRRIRLQDGVNMEYLRNIVLKYMSLKTERSQRLQLVPALASLLDFSKVELAGVVGANKERVQSWWRAAVEQRKKQLLLKRKQSRVDTGKKITAAVEEKV